MNIKKSFKKQVERFILSNANVFDKQQLYDAIADEFNLDRKTISRYYLDLLNKGVIDNFNAIPVANYTDGEVKKILRQDGNDLSVVLTIDHEISTLEQLLAVCEVDTTKWQVVSWQCGKHDLGIKNAQKQVERTQLFSVKAKFKPLTAENSLEVQKDILLKELFAQAPNTEDLEITHVVAVDSSIKIQPTCLLELALFDVHFGKLAHREESGEDYDLKIAVKRYKDSIRALLSRVNLSSIEKILLPIGNDMINVDNMAGLTTAGTPQDTDSRFYKIVRTVKNLLIETINILSTIAPVDVVVCAGNHDQQTSFMIGEMLEAFYYNNSLVTIDNSAAMRKYYQYGKASIMFTHGDKEKHANLGMIFAAENPRLWAATTQRFIQIGHFHHNKKSNYLSNEEMQGFQIQIIPSLSSNDAWHKAKGFLPLKQAKAFLYNRNEGLIGEFTYTI